MMAPEEADVVVIHPRNEEEFKFKSDPKVTAECIVRLFLSPSADQPATLCRLSDKMILWPAQQVPPGRYRLLVAPLPVEVPVHQRRRLVGASFAWSRTEEQLLLCLADAQHPLDFEDIPRREFSSGMDADTVRWKLAQLQQRR
jgi:hypothetical protein